MRWQQLKDFPSYEISEEGQIRRNGKLLKRSINAQGYYQLSLCEKGVRKTVHLHRLLAETFLPNPHNFPVVRHLDDNKLNNSLHNLCWGTYAENIEDAIVLGKNNVGIAVEQLKDSKVVATHRSLSMAAAAIGLANPSNSGASHIKEACEGRLKSLKGFTFRYKKEGDAYSLE